jgi:hypothetical protein
MKPYQVDPTKDARWAEPVVRHPKSSVFHSVGWLKALQYTYGYKPITFATLSLTEELKTGILFCQIDSWLPGRRLVALPFSGVLRSKQFYTWPYWHLSASWADRTSVF